MLVQQTTVFASNNMLYANEISRNFCLHVLPLLDRCLYTSHSQWRLAAVTSQRFHQAALQLGVLGSLSDLLYHFQAGIRESPRSLIG